MRSSPLQFCKTISDREVSDFPRWLIDSSRRAMSSCMAARNEVNPWPWRDKAIISVPVPAIPRPNMVAMVMAVIGFLLVLPCIIWPGVCFLGPVVVHYFLGWYRIFGTTATKMQNSSLGLNTEMCKQGVRTVREQIHHPPISGIIYLIPVSSVGSAV